jgi:hypothetical protein
VAWVGREFLLGDLTDLEHVGGARRALEEARRDDHEVTCVVVERARAFMNTIGADTLHNATGERKRKRGLWRARTSLDDLELVLGMPDGTLDDLIRTLHRLHDERDTASRDLNLAAHTVVASAKVVH